jgi:hypothetical protein
VPTFVICRLARSFTDESFYGAYEIRARGTVSGVEFNGMYSRLVFPKAHVDVGVQLVHEIICIVQSCDLLAGYDSDWQPCT